MQLLKLCVNAEVEVGSQGPIYDEPGWKWITAEDQPPPRPLQSKLVAALTGADHLRLDLNNRQALFAKVRDVVTSIGGGSERCLEYDFVTYLDDKYDSFSLPMVEHKIASLWEIIREAQRQIGALERKMTELLTTPKEVLHVHDNSLSDLTRDQQPEDSQDSGRAAGVAAV